jgi:hypothetical protein
MLEHMRGFVGVAGVASIVSLVLGCGDDGAPSGSTSEDPSTGSLTTTDVSSTTDASTSTSTSVASSEGSSTGSTGEGTSTGEASTGTGDATSTGTAICGPLVVEVFYDAEGGDDMLQWVELYNPCAEPIDLSTWTLGWGGVDYGPPRVKGLPGTVEAGGCFVVGGPTADASNGQPTYQYADDFAPGLDLALEAGGGVALFDAPSDEVDATTVPIDAVVYGPDNANALIDETGRPVAAPHVGNPATGGSIQRTSATATWVTAETPAPNDCPPF